jgi:hypothetical protein
MRYLPRDRGERGFVAETEIVGIIKNIKWCKAVACQADRQMHPNKWQPLGAGVPD